MCPLNVTWLFHRQVAVAVCMNIAADAFVQLFTVPLLLVLRLVLYLLASFDEILLKWHSCP